MYVRHPQILAFDEGLDISSLKVTLLKSAALSASIWMPAAVKKAIRASSFKSRAH